MNMIILNDNVIGLVGLHRWYQYQFDSIVANKLFESMMVNMDSYFSKIDNNTNTYNMNGIMLPETEIDMLLSGVIENRDMKFALLNMNHDDSRIRSVCKFIICSRGVYEIEYEIE